LHFSRFYPQYLLTDLPLTPQKTLERAHEICRAEGLQFVYLGNLAGHPAESTYCPGCGQMVIQRRGFQTRIIGLKDSHCTKCGREIPGLF
jgi:pyruvate formate lyase activating enzyme